RDLSGADVVGAGVGRDRLGADRPPAPGVAPPEPRGRAEGLRAVRPARGDQGGAHAVSAARARVELVDDPPNGLAEMLGSLIGANLDRDPERRRLLAPPRRIGLSARDAGVAVTMDLAPGRVRVQNGLVPPLDVRIEATGTELVELAGAPTAFGMPDLRTAQGRRAAGHLASRRIRIEGAARHPR